MRKFLYAGAVTGGLLLLGAAPAYAITVPNGGTDVVGTPINVLSGDGGYLGLVGDTGQLGVENPLGGHRVLNISPGTNSADVPGVGGSALPDENVLPGARSGLGQAIQQPKNIPAVDPAAHALPSAGGLPVGGLPLGGLPLPLGNLPVGKLLGGGLLGGGLGSAQEAGALGGDLPLLGGLGGLTDLGSLTSLLPAGPRRLPAFNGMPIGGVPVSATDLPGAGSPAAGIPARDAAKPAKPAKPATDPATANDPRLHEEPLDPAGKAASTDTREFSTGRPVAGVDNQYD